MTAGLSLYTICRVYAEARGSVVAFQAKRERSRAFEKPRVGGPVRNVAGFAAIDAYSDMFEREWPALIHVAFEAWLLIDRLVDHPRTAPGTPGWHVSTVRIVAVWARHESFVYSMLERHRELGPYIWMATVAKVNLGPGKQGFCRSRLMNGMTIRANYISAGVFRPADICAVKRLGVARYASVDDFAGLFDWKCKDRSFSALRFNVRLARPMTGFASLQMGRQRLIHGCLVVWIFEERGRNVRMAGSARLIANKVFLGGCFGVCSEWQNRETTN
jgi:hypothetical protein